MAYELRRKVELPPYIDGAFPSDALQKVITRSNLTELTKRELRIVKSEVAESLLAVDRDLEVAKTRAALPVKAPNYRAMNESWLARVKRMRECLLLLFQAVSKHLAEREPSDYEREAERIAQRTSRRERRQRYLVQAFADLVREEFGAEKLDELLRKADQMADRACSDLENQKRPGPVCFFDRSPAVACLAL